MGRRYTVPFEKQTITTTCDLAGIFNNSTKLARLLRFWVDECDNPSLVSAFDLDLAVIFFPPTVARTGGTVISGSPLDNGDAASGVTAFYVTTSLTTTSGTQRTVWSKSCHIYQGVDVMLGDGIPIINTQAVSLQIKTAPPTSILLSGGIMWEELGG